MSDLDLDGIKAALQHHKQRSTAVTFMFHQTCCIKKGMD
jgi:hypothetical protein